MLKTSKKTLAEQLDDKADKNKALGEAILKMLDDATKNGYRMGYNHGSDGALYDKDMNVEGPK